jgi:hypothetical protein
MGLGGDFSMAGRRHDCRRGTHECVRHKNRHSVAVNLEVNPC